MNERIIPVVLRLLIGHVEINLSDGQPRQNRLPGQTVIGGPVYSVRSCRNRRADERSRRLRVGANAADAVPKPPPRRFGIVEAGKDDILRRYLQRF
ncbi:hypothetical protein D3C76_1301540 [compost metagenome]